MRVNYFLFDSTGREIGGCFGAEFSEACKRIRAHLENPLTERISITLHKDERDMPKPKAGA